MSREDMKKLQPEVTFEPATALAGGSDGLDFYRHIAKEYRTYLAKDGVMGYLSIPKINVKLAIYHGSEEEVLQTGIGHINGTKLPIGGESTHCVLAAHRGLPSARLFTDID